MLVISYLIELSAFKEIPNVRNQSKKMEMGDAFVPLGNLRLI